jgi:UDP-N-acetylmuramyl pentapeptide phosphotransferase/UDP-N-acetylglucosamine-1-phosphate transferase
MTNANLVIGHCVIDHYHAPVPLDSPLLFFPFVAFCLGAVLHAAALTVFPRWKLLDFPERYGLRRAPIPYPTGLIPLGLFVVFFLILQPATLETTGIVAGILLLGISCFIDDRTPLPPWLRLTLQLGVAIVLVACSVRIEAMTNPFPWWLPGETLQLEHGWFLLFSIVFTVGWLLLTVNALNWFDGIAGQVSTLSTIAFLTIGFLSLSTRVNQPGVALLAFVLAGLSLSCLFFDLPPPRLLMGDTGAMFFGLMIGILTIFSGGKVATAFLVLGVPLIDVFLVILRRLRRGQSIARGNSTDQHLHHRLLAKGWSPRQVILCTALIGATFGCTALFLSTRGKIAASMILLIVMAGLSWYSKPRT